MERVSVVEEIVFWRHSQGNDAWLGRSEHTAKGCRLKVSYKYLPPKERKVNR
jgi:hypothetical protein